MNQKAVGKHRGRPLSVGRVSERTSTKAPGGRRPSQIGVQDGDPPGAAGLLVVAAAVLGGTTGTAQALGPAAPPAAVGALRLAGGGAVLLMYVLAQPRLRSGLALCWTDGAWPLTLAGATGVAAYQIFFFTGVRVAGVALGTLVAIGSAPVFAGLLGRIAGELLTFEWGLATLSAGASVALLTLAGTSTSTSAAGVGLALGAGASYGGYTVAARTLLARGHQYGPVAATFFVGGAVLLAPVLTMEPVGWATEHRGIVMVMWLAVAATALPYLLWARGLTAVSAALATTLLIAEPLTASLLGIFFLDEHLTSLEGLGALLVIGAILVALKGLQGAPD